jgi:gliding motility-associated-like protein
MWTNIDPIYICPGDSVHFCGNFYITPQDVICENPLDGCSAQIQPILFKEEFTEDLGIIAVCPGECATVNGMQFCNPNVYEIPKNQCDTVLRFVVEVLDFEIALNGIEEITCDKPQIQLEASSFFPNAVFDYIWTDSDGMIVATGPLALILTGGDYTVEGTGTINGYSCSKTLDFVVDEDSGLPSFTIDAEDINCNNTEVQVDFLTGSTITSYSWTGPSAFTSNIPDPILTVAGDYELTVVSANGCVVSQLLTVEEDLTNPTLDWEDPKINCFSPSIPLNISSDIPIIEYQWVTPDGNPGNGMVLMIDQAGMYSVTAVGENGCTTQFDVQSTGDFDLPQATINSETITCDKQVITLSFETNYTIINQNWVIPGGSIMNTASLDISTGGNYILELEADNGCTNQIPVNIIEDNSPPLIEAGNDMLWNCNTETILLNGSVETGNFNINWTTPNGTIQTGNSTNTPEVSDPGMYYFEVVNPQNGCVALDSINIQINDNYPTDARINTIDPQCFGDNSGMIQIDEVIGGVPPFNVLVDGKTIGSEMVMNDYGSGIYSIEVQDANECSYVTEIELFDPQEIILELEERVQLYYGDETNIKLGYNITEEEVLTIIWMDQDLNIVSTGNILNYAPIKSETITAILTSIDDCEIIEDIKVNLRKSIDIYSPNAFTPNNDGVNDRFILFGRSDIAIIKSMYVFDRWGNTVYTGNDLQLSDESNGWDGRWANQKDLNPGVYVYAAVVELLDGTSFNFKGSVTLIR